MELKNVKPEMIGIDRLFTLNTTSKLLDMYQEQVTKEEALDI
jgi:hypothetical protein